MQVDKCKSILVPQSVNSLVLNVNGRIVLQTPDSTPGLPSENRLNPCCVLTNPIVVQGLAEICDKSAKELEKVTDFSKNIHKEESLPKNGVI